MVFGFGKKEEQANSSKQETLATQQFIDIKEIKEGIIILKDYSMRIILEVSSINFALKGVDEQNAIILQFQEFLNSLDFPIQITINSRRLDIVPYMNFLKHIGEQHQNELLRTQTKAYLSFIQGMVDLQNIMSKKFYIIVPLHRALASMKGIISKQEDAEQKEMSSEEYLKSRNQILQRADHVILGVRRMSLRAQLLDSEQILNLLVQLYNPTAQLREMNLPTSGLENYS